MRDTLKEKKCPAQCRGLLYQTGVLCVDVYFHVCVCVYIVYAHRKMYYQEKPTLFDM